MNHKFNNQLEKELLQAGASRTEAESLVALGGQLRALAPEKQPTVRYWEAGGAYLRRLLPSVVSGLACLLLGISLVIFAQASVPGQVLYGVKRASERAVTVIHPGYRENIMLRRAREVDALVTKNAPQQQVLASLTSYTAAAHDYLRHDSDNPDSQTPIRSYCKETLQLAAAKTSGAERTAITEVVALL